MADVAAKREARRRKILENSEYRLQRITGHVKHDETSDDQNKKETPDVETTTPSFTPNGILTKGAMMHDQNLDALIDEINTDLEEDEQTEGICYLMPEYQHIMMQQERQQKILDQNCASARYGNSNSFESNNSNSHEFLHDEDFHPSAWLDSSEKDIPNTIVEEPSLLANIFSSRLIFVALAIIVNIMVVFKLEHLFGTSVIVPFFIVMTGRMCTTKKVDTLQDNNTMLNMLVAALILSNCRPDFVKAIQRLKGTFSMFAKISRDLAVYVFTFILCYTILFPYNNDYDDKSIESP